MTDNYNVVTVPVDQLKELQAKLIASQLREKALWEALACGRNSMSSLAECGKIANCALSQPTDTAEADELLARAKRLEVERDQWKNDAIHGGNAQYLREQLTAARAVIEEVEAGLHANDCEADAKSCCNSCRALARIREWKETGK